jgi:hypothetical protein
LGGKDVVYREKEKERLMKRERQFHNGINSVLKSNNGYG